MGQAYYNLDEAKQKLDTNDDGLKDLVREGKLREFRDGGKVHFKTGDVDKLVAEAGSSLPERDASGSGEIMLEPVEEASPSSGSGSLPGLAPDTADASGSGSGLIELEDSDAAHADEVTLDDSTAPKDIRKDDTVITTAGISVFDDDDLEVEADPMAKTVLTASASDQVAMEGIGSGSGLLDLTREADDTSLGAELLDEIYPGDEAKEDVSAEEATAGIAAEQEDDAAIAVGPALAAPRLALVADPMDPVFTSILVVGAVVLGLAGATAAAFTQGVWPDYLKFVYEQFWIFFGASFGILALVALVGFFMCKPKVGRR